MDPITQAMDTSMQIALLGIFLAIYLYLMPKFLKYKEYKEKKRETMFNWVHENLTEDVYIPLADYAWAISDTLLQKEYKEEIVLHRISKFLSYIFKNRRIFGSDVYFTPNESSNRLLETISGKIVSEINAIYDIQGDKNIMERRIVIMEFLATCAKSKNYSEFRLLISGKPIANKNLTDEIGRLMDGYSNDHYLPRRYGDHSRIFLDPINEMINPQNLVQAWIRSKLYVYCILFNKLFMYEIHEMYDSWYIDHPNTLDYHQLADTISLVNRIVKKIDDKLEDDLHIHKESYSKSSMGDTHKKLEILKQGLASTDDSTDKKEIEQKIKQFENKLEILESVKLLGAISLRRDEVLEENRSEEFYRNILDIKISKNKWSDYIKFRLHMVKMIISFKINKRETNDYLILTTTIIIFIAISLLLLELVSW